MSLEDYSGREEFYMYAQKDKTEKILNNFSRRSDNNSVVSIGKNSLEEVQSNKTEYVGGNASLVIGSPATGFFLDTGLRLDPRGLRAVTYYIDNISPDSGSVNYTLNVGGTKTEFVAQASSERVGGDKVVHATGDAVLTSEQKMYLASHSTFQVTVGASYALTVADSITLTCGESSLTLSKNGDITLEGNDIKIKGKNKIELN